MMRGTFRQKLRNNAAAISVCVITALSAGAVVFANKCGDRGRCGKAPMSEPIRNDGICDQREAYPYLRNKDGTVMKDSKGNPVKNPYYSKADCYSGDEVCDNAASISELKDSAGNSVDPKTLITQGTNIIKFMDGRMLMLPLEKDDSYGCQMKEVRNAPCSPEPGAEIIGRPLLSRPDPLTPIVQRSQESIETIFRTPSRVQPGNNYLFVMPNLYKESCGAGLPVCDPNVPIECYCPNHKSCIPSTCGNGKLDKGEECDPKHLNSAYRAKPGYACSATTCKWVKRADPPKPMEPMAMEEAPQPRCGDGKVNQASEECDPPGSKCADGSTCNVSCKCEKPAPAEINRCQSDQSVTALIRTVRKYTNGKAANFSKLYDHTASATATVNVRIVIGADGRGQTYSVTSACTGETCRRNKLSASENTAAFGPFLVGTISITPQGARCYISVRNSISPN